MIQLGDAITVGTNPVMFGSKAEFSTADGLNGTVVFKVGHSTYSVPVTRRPRRRPPS